MRVEQEEEDQLTILHFNDVYDIEPNLSDQHGFVNFYQTYLTLKTLHPESLVLFSGDAFAPSKLSKIKKGHQMTHCLKHLKIDAACFGNHEFDFPLQHTMKLVGELDFPWLLGNVRNKQTGRFLGEGLEYVVMDRGRFVIGVFGLVGPDFRGRLISAYKDIVEYEDCTERAKQLCQILRKKRCNLIIALTHMRIPPDEILAKNVPQIDIILGGHDHTVFSKQVNKIPILKSGTNFQHIGLYKILPLVTPKKATYHGRRWSFLTTCLPIPKKKNKYPELEAYISEVVKQYKERGTAKPESKFKKEKFVQPQDFWKVRFTRLNGREAVELGSAQRSQVVFGKFLCFQRKMYFSKSFTQPNYQISEDNCIQDDIKKICKQLINYKLESRPVIYSSGYPFIPYLIQTCNAIYLPNQLSCTTPTITHLQTILLSCKKSSLNCYSIIDLFQQYTTHLTNNHSHKNNIPLTLTPTIKFIDMPGEFRKVIGDKKVGRVIGVGVETDEEFYLGKGEGKEKGDEMLAGRVLLRVVMTSGRICYVDYHDCLAHGDKVNSVDEQNKQLEVYRDILALLNKQVPDFTLTYPQLLHYLTNPNCPPISLIPTTTLTTIPSISTSIIIKSPNSQVLQNVNTLIAYNMGRQFIDLNYVKQEGKEERYRGVVFNQGFICYPMYQLGYGYLPVLFEGGVGDKSTVLSIIDYEDIGQRRWFNLTTNPNHPQHPIHIFSQTPNPPSTTTITLNTKSNKTAEWVTKYAKTSYSNVKYLKQSAIIDVFRAVAKCGGIGVYIYGEE